MQNWQAKRGAAVSILFVMLLAAMPLPPHLPLVRRQLPGVYVEFTSLSFYVTDGLALLLLLTAVPWRQRSDANPFYPRWLAALLAGLVGWTAVSLTWTFDFTTTAQMSLRLLLSFALARAIMRWRPGRRWQAWGIGSMVGMQTAVAIAQFIRQNDLGLRWLGELDLNRYPGGGSILAVGDTYFLRAYGLTPHPNMLGGFLAIGVLILTAVYLIHSTEANTLPAPRSPLPILLGLIVASGAGLLLTFPAPPGWGRPSAESTFW